MTDLNYTARRLGGNRAPGCISRSGENRSQLICIPAAPQGQYRAELRSSCPAANPCLASALLIRAGLYGIKNRLPLPESANVNLFHIRAAVPELILSACTNR